MKWLGVDTGGTFTDFVLVDEAGNLTIHKVLSTPSSPEQAILQGIRDLKLEADITSRKLHLVHGSTVATNAALERKGVKTAYVANQGLADVLTIGRQARRELYNLNPVPEAPPVPESLCFEVAGRLGADGDEVEPISDPALAELVEAVRQAKPEAIAINLLFSFLNDTHEKQVQQALEQAGDWFVSRSSDVLPEYKEYERGIATWLNAWLGPIVAAYLRRLGDALAPGTIAMMQSSGGTIALDQAAGKAVNLLLSGPAGGLAAALHLGTELGRPALLTFDMGGTSTDVAMLDGHISLTNEGSIAGYPVAVPMVDMHTIGAGGGSIAWIDEGGLLQVGPQSAGADPGPACYGKGGQHPTVTDANLVLGRIPPDVRLGGTLPLDRDAAVAAMKPLAAELGMAVEDLAEGIIRLANEHMVRALRVISVFRGRDPKEFALCCFGGAGGLHLCDLAEELGMEETLVPANAGVLSAFGMLVAPRQRTLTRTIVTALKDVGKQELEGVMDSLRRQGEAELVAEHVQPEAIQAEIVLACRYRGQSFTLDLVWDSGSDRPEDLESRFSQAHELRYGYALERAVEIVTVQCRLTAPVATPSLQSVIPVEAEPVMVEVAGEAEAVAVAGRDSLTPGREVTGPMIVTDRVSTLYLKRGWKLSRTAFDHLILTRV